MVGIAQLVRASDCGSEGRGFEPHCLPKKFPVVDAMGFFLALIEQYLWNLNSAIQVITF